MDPLQRLGVGSILECVERGCRVGAELVVGGIAVALVWAVCCGFRVCVCVGLVYSGL